MRTVLKFAFEWILATLSQAYAKTSAATTTTTRTARETSEAGKALKISQAERQTDRPIDPQTDTLCKRMGVCHKRTEGEGYSPQWQQPLSLASRSTNKLFTLWGHYHYITLHYIIQQHPPPPALLLFSWGTLARPRASIEIRSIVGTVPMSWASRPRERGRREEREVTGRNFFKMRPHNVRPLSSSPSLSVSLSLASCLCFWVNEL